MEWLEPWGCNAHVPEQVVGMGRELRRELRSGHPLYGLPVRALARRQDCDDVLFAIEDGTKRVAVVHLTWTHHSPEPLPWPITVIYPNFEVWVVEGMRSDHDSLQ